MLLSDRSIMEAIKEENLIFPYNRDNLQPCSYDVTLDNVFKTISRDHGTSYIDAVTKETIDCSYFTMNNNNYTLMPGEFVLGSTIETVKIPNGIAARFEGKSSLGRIGLSTHITAGFIDPGFRGNITLEIHNVNAVPIMLHAGMKIGQLCFMTLDNEVERPYGSSELGSHYQGQNTVTEARG